MGLFLPVNAAHAEPTTIFGPTGAGPRHMVFDPAGNLYVANFNDNNVSKITPAGVSTILGTTGTHPRGIAIDQSGNIYTANIDSNDISKITPAGGPSGSTPHFASTGTNPYNLAIDSSGNIYTANYGSNSVTKITPAGDPTTIQLGTTGTRPASIAIDSSGNIYTGNVGSSTVTKITPAGVPSLFGTTGSTPISIAIDSTGNLYVANLDSNNVTKITPAGTPSTFASNFISPWAITVDSSGNVYTTNLNANRVSKITPAGVSRIIAKATGRTPTGIAIDSSGNIYTANRDDNTVSKITAAEANILEPGTLFATHAGEGSRSMVTDLAGNFYIANHDTNNVTKITPAGVSTILGTTGNGPVGIALDSLGNIYTANENDRTVSKITPAGVSTEHFGDTGQAPYNLVVDKAGNIYVANYFGTNPNLPSERGISKITSAGVSTVNFVSTGDSTQLTNIVIDQADNLYVTSCGVYTAGGIGDVRKITPAGVVTTLGTTGKCPNSLVLDAAGNIYTSNFELNAISKITPAGVSTPDWGQIEGTSAIGLAIDPLGNIYTANSSAHSVSKITPAGVSTILGITGAGAPNGIVYSSGSIYTANSNGSVYKFPLTTTTAGSVPNSQVATISSGQTGVIVPSTAALPATTLKFGGAVPTAVTVAPVASNPAAPASTPFKILGSTKIVDIQITGTFNGSATVCLDGSPTDSIFHFVGGKWEELPSRSYANGQVCGVTTSFSPFAAAEPAPANASPDAPASVVATATGKRSATVTFSAPSSNGGAVITSYTATSTPGSITKTLTQAGGGTFTFDGLQPGTSYTFAVTAKNANGTSTAGTSNSIKTSAADIASLTSITFTDDGSGTAGKLTWVGSKIDSVLYTGPAGSYPGPFTFGAFSSSWNGSIRNLTPETSYTISIYAVSVDGIGESKSLTFKTGVKTDVVKNLAYWNTWLTANTYSNGEAARLFGLLTKFNSLETSPIRSFIKVPVSLASTVSATSLTPKSCSVVSTTAKVDAGMVKALTKDTCTISYTVSGPSKAPATLVKDFVFKKVG